MREFSVTGERFWNGHRSNIGVDDHMNILCMGGRTVGLEVAWDLEADLLGRAIQPGVAPPAPTR